MTEKLFDERQQQQQQRQQQQQQQQQQQEDGDDAHSCDLMPVVLLANKCDLPDLKVPRNKYSTYVRENGLLAWYETSARDPSCGVALAVRRLVEYVLETDPSLRVARENAMIWKRQ